MVDAEPQLALYGVQVSMPAGGYLYKDSVDEADKERLMALRRQNRRRQLTTPVVEAWAEHGVSASPLSDERQQGMLRELDWWVGGDFNPVSDLRSVIEEFVGPEAMVVVIDFDVREHPALLVPARALIRSEGELRKIYPDGMVLVTGSASLVIDFGEQLGRANVLRSPS